MGTTSRADSKRMYSWWWDSHISPKNSKWLQENLTDMDVKVKHMIKLLEEDADSFARRAEMYYKKRPELMKLVEEFYRAYRALAERYDHATGVLRQAHRSIAEAFPNQVPLIFSDDSPSGSDLRTPEMPNTHALFDPDELQKDALGVSSFHIIASKRNGAFTEESDSLTSKKGLKQFNELFGPGERRARKGLYFDGLEDTDGNDEKKGIHDHVDRTEAEILPLKKVLAKLEAEKEESSLQYQKSQEMLSKLELEVSCAQENSKTLDERAGGAEAEVQTLREVLSKLESEREFSLLQYQKCLDKISTLKNDYLQVKKDAGELAEQVAKAGIEVHSLKQENVRVEAEKEAALGQYNKSLEMISNLEEKVHHMEKDARRYKEQAEKAENEVIIMKQALAKLTEEKEAAALQYRQCLEKIASLENQISCAQEEAENLKHEIEYGNKKSKNSEERCSMLEKSNQNLQSDLESVEQKMGSQNQEIIEKNQELGRLWTCVQEERFRFVEAETAFQALQHLHFQCQEELRSLAAEIQDKAQSLKDMENQNQGLENELGKVKEERNNLNELNLSSAVSIKNLQDEISSLREIIGKLEAEVELRVDQRNALQQEIYFLKEELKELKEICEVERSDKAVLLEKLKIMGDILEKNAFLENSLSDLHDNLEAAREKVKGLEESCESLFRENSTLFSEKTTLSSQLQIATEDIEKYLEKNILLENSFSDASSKLNELKVRSKSLEDSCLLHEKEKSCLIAERENLVSQLEISRKTLEDREKRCAELEEKYIGLDNESQSLLREVEELRTSLDAEMQEHASLVQVIETQLASMKSVIHLLQEECHSTKLEYEEEVDKSINSQIEIFVLQRCVRDMEENIFSLVLECQKLLEETKLSAKLITEAENENLKKQVEVKSLFGHIESLKMGLHQVLNTLGEDADQLCEEKSEQDQEVLNNILRKLKDTQNYLFEICDENQQLEIEKSIIVESLGKIKVEAENLVTEQNMLDRDFRIQSEELSILKFESQNLLQLNEELKFKILERDLREVEMRSEMGNICRKLYNLEGAYRNLQGETCKVLDGKKTLKNEVINLREEKIELEEETIIQTQLYFLFKDIISEKVVELKELRENLNEIHFRKNDLEEKVKVMEANLGEVQMENLQLTKSQERSENELVKSEEKLNLIQNEKAELCKMVEELKTKLEVELGKMHEEAEENKIKEEDLSYELEKKRNEVELWENQAAALFGELQVSTVCEALFVGKINELDEAYEKLEDRSSSKDMEIEMMREKVSNLGSENGGLRAQLAAYVPAVISLKDAITSLEEHTLVQKDPPEDCKQEAKDTDLVNYLHSGSSQPRYDEQSGMELSGSSELQDLQRRIQAIEMAVVEETLEKLHVNTKLEMVMREIEEVKSGSSSHQIGRTSKHTKKQGENELRNAKQRPKSEISEEGSEFLTKDILLDQISECSSYGISKREIAETDNQMLELWGSINHDSSIDLTVGKTRNMPASSHKNKHSSMDSLIENGLSVDKLEISNRFPEPHQGGNKRKILERLDSDAQKLTNLQITVQDLKRKVDITEKTKKGNKGVEYDNVKGKLEESEAAIVKLFDVNKKLTKNVQNGSPSYDETWSVRQSRISEQARRGSEKIGRLQLEVQRLQFLLLKMDGDKESRNRTRVAERKTRVLLRDYLYGGVKRSSHNRKKAPFCGCVQPPTKGDWSN